MAASIPNLMIHETAGGALEWGEKFMNQPFKLDRKTGWATLPEGLKVPENEMSLWNCTRM